MAAYALIISEYRQLGFLLTLTCLHFDWHDLALLSV